MTAVVAFVAAVLVAVVGHILLGKWLLACAALVLALVLWFWLAGLEQREVEA